MSSHYLYIGENDDGDIVAADAVDHLRNFVAIPVADIHIDFDGPAVSQVDSAICDLNKMFGITREQRILSRWLS